jgi:hypothetical protein
MNQPHDPTSDTPELEPWMLDLAKAAVDDLDASVEVPREMMWKRIEKQRAPRAAWRWRQVAGIAAVLVGGVAIGRYVVPSPTTPSVAVDTLAPNATDGASLMGNDPSRVAMQEHLAHTVALLAAVNDGSSEHKATPDIGPQARDLLTTTRLLLDQPQLRDSTTRRLLQDLELVLVQVVQARGSAPETQRAPRETLKETNLLTRVRAVVTASSRLDAPVYGGSN